MAHESFEEPDIHTLLMNRLFVDIKVNQEEQPTSTPSTSRRSPCSASRAAPHHVPEAQTSKPFWGGASLPPSGNLTAGFRQVLGAIADTWTKEPDKVGRNVDALRESLATLRRSAPGGPIPIAAIDQVAARIVREIDPYHGGLGGAPKFPQAWILEVLWRAFLTGAQASPRRGPQRRADVPGRHLRSSRRRLCPLQRRRGWRPHFEDALKQRPAHPAHDPCLARRAPHCSRRAFMSSRGLRFLAKNGGRPGGTTPPFDADGKNDDFRLRKKKK